MLSRRADSAAWTDVRIRRIVEFTSLKMRQGQTSEVPAVERIVRAQPNGCRPRSSGGDAFPPQADTIRDQLDSLVNEAGRRELTIRETLGVFCEREIARKDKRRIEMSIGLALFPFVRDLAGFDFAAQPSIDKRQVRELATGRFIANGEALLLLGPPGVGKIHLAVAIGRDAITAGYTVLFVAAPTLVAQLAKAHAEGRLGEKLTQFANRSC